METEKCKCDILTWDSLQLKIMNYTYMSQHAYVLKQKFDLKFLI